MTQSAASQLERLRARDPDTLAGIFEQYSDRVYGLALRILHDEQQADGVVQNTFVTLIEKINTFEGRSHISTWLYRIAYNECMGRLRNTKSDVSVDAFLDSDFMPENFVNWETIPDSILHSQEAQTEMEQAINRLSPLLRTTFILRDVEGLSTKDAASVMNISEDAVKTRLHRARLFLRESLADYFEEYT